MSNSPTKTVICAVALLLVGCAEPHKPLPKGFMPVRDGYIRLVEGYKCVDVFAPDRSFLGTQCDWSE